MCRSCLRPPLPVPFLGAVLSLSVFSSPLHAAASAEVYSAQSYGYGKFEAHVRFPEGDGVIGSFFLWKDGSEKAEVFWNELDFEKIGAACEVQTNSIFGLPESGHELKLNTPVDACNAYHTYAFEWTPRAIRWLVDAVEVRRDEGELAQAYADHAADGLRFDFNIWPGNASFGGEFSETILPVHQYIAWVQYSTWDGANTGDSFTLQFRESFEEGLPAQWRLGSWESPFGLSTHSMDNVAVEEGTLTLSLTTDEGIGPTLEVPLSSGELPTTQAEEEPPVDQPEPVQAPEPTLEESRPRGNSGCALSPTDQGSCPWLFLIAGAALLTKGRRRRLASRTLASAPTLG